MKPVDKSKIEYLRQKAEVLEKSCLSKTNEQLSESDILKFHHELEVYRKELELQNEELLQAKAMEQQTAEKYMELYDNSPSGYYTLSAEGKIIELNLTGSQMLGKDRSKLINSSFGFFVAKESRPGFSQFLQNVFQKKTNQTCELSLICHDKLPKYVLLSGIAHAEQNHCHISATIITERILMEKEICMNEEKLQTIFDGTHDGILYIDTNTKVIDANKAFTKITGITREDVIGKTGFSLARKFVSIKHLPFIINILKNIVKKKPTELYELEYQDKILEFSTSKLNSGNNITVIRDITTKKKAIENLKESEEQLQIIFDQAGVGAAEIDTDSCKYLRINKRYCEIVGYTQSEMLSMDFKQITHPDDLQEHLDNMERLKAGKNYEFTTEKRYRKKDGDYVWIKHTVSQIWSATEKRQHHIAIVEDITERKQVEKALNEVRTFNANLIKSLPIGLALTSMDGALIEVNDAYCSIIGRSVEDTKKLTYWEITPEKYAEAERQMLDNLTKTGKYGPFEKEYIHKDGNLVPVRLQGKIVERDNVKYIWSSIEDISVRKQIEKEDERKASIDKALADLYALIISPTTSMLNIALMIKNHAMELTNSTQCYVGIIDPENGDLVSHTLTEMMENGQCAILQET